MGKTAEDMVRAGELHPEALHAFVGRHNRWLPACPACGVHKPLFVIEHHDTLGLSCDWCRVDADRQDAAPDDDELWRGIEDERRSRLNESLWATAEDGTVNDQERAAWGAYRLAVAQVGPKTFTNPKDVVWPPRPGPTGA